MHPRLRVKDLAREAQAERKAARTARVAVGLGRAEGLSKPAPAHHVAGVHHHAGRVQVIGVDEVDQRRVEGVGWVRGEHGHGQVTQPHVLTNRRAIHVVLAQQVILGVVGVGDGGTGTQRTALAHAPTCIVIGVGGDGVPCGEGREAPAQVIGQCVVAVGGGVAGRVVAQAHRRVAQGEQTVACRVHGVGGRRSAIERHAGAVAVGVVGHGPLGAGSVGLGDAAHGVVAELLIQLCNR